VDVAVAQQALPVPNENTRRQHIAVSQAESSSSLPPPRDRYNPYMISADVALQHQQVYILNNFNCN
jgi:hypothetical protein